MRPLLVISLVALLSACGLQGDLYLPQPKEPAAAQPATPAAPSDDENPKATNAKRMPSRP